MKFCCIFSIFWGWKKILIDNRGTKPNKRFIIDPKPHIKTSLKDYDNFFSIEKTNFPPLFFTRISLRWHRNFIEKQRENWEIYCQSSRPCFSCDFKRKRYSYYSGIFTKKINILNWKELNNIEKNKFEFQQKIIDDFRFLRRQTSF